GHELEAPRAVHRPPLGRPGLERRHVLRPRLPEHVGGLVRAGRQQRAARQLHRRERRRELRHRDAGVAGEDVPRAGRAGAPGHLEEVQRPSGDRLLAGQPVDEGLLRVLEGRPVHEARGRRARGRGSPRRLPLRGRAHLGRLPGLPQRRCGDRPAGRRRDRRVADREEV
ncbi:MAG: hypothetical protein AVDCRST_MAG85-213, partial [uncultured Solirubrobacteraceae bacterium]